ncbi:hypothetical protein PAHAL_3G110200 [Panicum hallii]|jgi:hypothetical protein|uniref:Uncharacterized protein n=1 Tax=Panicum hallii TaxID=206008 RepID=A0A2T8KHT8_9POAL|nr:hypothetical protein PAHAL_3G110200 [Panicum hallii]
MILLLCTFWTTGVPQPLPPALPPSTASDSFVLSALKSTTGSEFKAKHAKILHGMSKTLGNPSLYFSSSSFFGLPFYAHREAGRRGKLSSSLL